MLPTAMTGAISVVVPLFQPWKVYPSRLGAASLISPLSTV